MNIDTRPNRNEEVAYIILRQRIKSPQRQPEQDGNGTFRQNWGRGRVGRERGEVLGGLPRE